MKPNRFPGRLFCTLTALIAVGLSCDDEGPGEPVYTGKGGSGLAGGTGGVPVFVDGSTFDGDAGPGSGGTPGDAGAFDVPPLPPFTKQALLGAIADCAIDRFQAFQTSANGLRDALTAYATSLAPADLDLARSAWLGAMGVWQQAELFQVGPAARSPASGNQGLRDRIYSYPLSGHCLVDVQIVDQRYAKPDFASSLINGRGLGALEYLLFHAGASNACAATAPINAQGTWASLSAPELLRRRADYALAAARDVAQSAALLVTAWAPDAGNFRQTFVSAGAGSSVYAHEQDALSAGSDALFYLEREVKDLKVGKPIGLVDCFTPTCPEALESPLARTSTQNVVNNLLGFRRLFQGCGPDGYGLGYDDWLRAIGQADLATLMEARLAAALTNAATLDPPLESALQLAPDKVRSLFQAIKSLSELLKADFLSVLSLGLPADLGDDTD